jgi:UDP-N-acetylmuramyl pentapeptide phosphotransferase/UDP-N-acetylglucosamine-1-phosphate transferase
MYMAKPDNPPPGPSIVAAAVAIAGATLLAGPVALAGALASLALTALARPLFFAYALARPNARSSHIAPVPQGGGATVIAATLCAAAVGLALLPAEQGAAVGFGWIAAAALLLALVGAWDDIRGLPVRPRLTAQIIAVAAAVHGLSGGGQILPLPPALEFALLVLAGTWFVNLTNFMDGIDGITLATFLPLAGGAVMLGSAGAMSAGTTLLAMAFLGALAGFVFFNVPRARLFLGDVGSLSIGLIGGALLLDLAQHGAMAAAIILPLYHFTDATATLLGRLMRREKVWEAHRQHAYQRAVDGGWSHARVSGIVLALNTALVGLATLTLGRSAAAQLGLVVIAFTAVVAVIVLFRSRKPAP